MTREKTSGACLPSPFVIKAILSTAGGDHGSGMTANTNHGSPCFSGSRQGVPRVFKVSFAIFQYICSIMARSCTEVHQQT